MRTPIAPRQEEINNEHGIFRVDPCAWIKDWDDPTTIPYLETENAYTEHTMAPTDSLRETLCQELVGRIQEDNQSVPVVAGKWWRYSRTESGKVKWVARLRNRKTDDNLFVLRTLKGAGCCAASGRYGHIDDLSWMFSFVLDQLSMIHERVDW